MNAGVLRKCIRETRAGTLWFALGVFLFQVAITTVTPGFVDQLAEHLLRLDFLRNILRALLGADVGDSLGPGAITAIAWVHPVLLSLFWAHAISFATRFPAGEIDRGTIDILLSWPVSRGTVLTTESVVGVLSGAILVLATAAGHWTGRTIGGELGSPDWGPLAAMAINLWALHIAVYGLSSLVSTLSQRRVPAMGTMFGFVLLSLFWQFLGQFWPPATHVSFLSVLTYYRPFAIQQGSPWPFADLLILVGIGAGAWWIGRYQFLRRDVATL